jgi:hypothetical protein
MQLASTSQRDSDARTKMRIYSLTQGRYHYIELFSLQFEEGWLLKLHDTKRQAWTNHYEVFPTAEEAQTEAVRLAISYVLQNGDKPTQDPSRVVWCGSEFNLKAASNLLAFHRH